MREFRVFEKKGQGSEAVEAFRAFIRGSVREMIWHAMVLEVDELCGPKHGLVIGETHRAGSSPGSKSEDAASSYPSTATPRVALTT